MKRKIRHIGIGLLLMIGSMACTQPFDNHKNNPSENFEALWQIIDEKYCLFDDKTVDWDSIYTIYQPQFDTIKIKQYVDNYRMFDLMEEMLNTLEDGHVNLYSPFDVSICRKWYEGYPANFDSEILTKNYLKDYRRAGGLNYCKIAGDSIGYVYYGSFSDSFSMMNWLAVLTYFEQCRGIVLDVRNNGGGNMENAYKLAAPFFVNDNTIVGYWQHKSGVGHKDFSQMKEMIMDNGKGYWKRPVVVLCNRHNYSAANFFVSMMRYAHNCLIVGGISGGGGGMPMSYELPNGWLVRFSSVKMYDIDMQSIEGGITPDVAVNQQSKDKDDLIEAAVELINSTYKKD